MTNPDTIAVIVGDCPVRKPDDGNGDDDAYNAGWNACRAYFADRLAALGDVEKDAARYRWLRNQPVNGAFGLPRIAVATSEQSGFFVNLEDADETVDAAMGIVSPFCPVCGGRDESHAECTPG